MSIIVQKFGGSSVANVERIQAIVERICEAKAGGHQVVVVVSAMGSETDDLLDLAQAVQSDAGGRELDMLLAAGEQKSMALLAMALNAKQCAATSLLGWQAGIETTGRFNQAKITHIDTDKIRQHLNNKHVVIVAGFQGLSHEGDMTTLGRGGSDLTAVALASALHAKECHIFTDVLGVHTADPRLVPDAPKIDEISFEEMLELSSSGARVLHKRAVELAGKLNVVLRVMSSFTKGSGTLMSLSSCRSRLAGLSYLTDQVRVCIAIPAPANDFVATCLASLKQHDILVQFFSQTTLANGHGEISFVLHAKDLDLFNSLSEAWVKPPGITVSFQTHLAELSVIGAGLHTELNIAARVFDYLAKSKVNVFATCSTELKLAILIEQVQLEKTLVELHDVLGLAHEVCAVE